MTPASDPKRLYSTLPRLRFSCLRLLGEDAWLSSCFCAHAVFRSIELRSCDCDHWAHLSELTWLGLLGWTHLAGITWLRSLGWDLWDLTAITWPSSHGWDKLTLLSGLTSLETTEITWANPLRWKHLAEITEITWMKSLGWDHLDEITWLR